MVQTAHAQPCTGAERICIKPGFDLFQTGPGTQFNGFAFEGRPVGVFDFGGDVGVRATAEADTIVERAGTSSVATASVAAGPTTSHPIRIVLRALSIRSEGEIDPDGVGPAPLGHYYVTMQAERGPEDPPCTTTTGTVTAEVPCPPSEGLMDVTFNGTNFGTFESAFHVRVDLRRCTSEDMADGECDGFPQGQIELSTDLSLVAHLVPWGRFNNAPDIVRIIGANRAINGFDTADDFWSNVDEVGNAPQRPRGGCTSDADCPSGTSCDTTARLCFVPPCTDTSQCDSDEFCNTTTHQCQTRCFPHDEANAIHCTGRPFCQGGDTFTGTGCDGRDQNCDGIVDNCPEDTTPPTATSPGDKSYECTSHALPVHSGSTIVSAGGINTSPGANGTASATDDCRNPVANIFNVDVPIDTCGGTHSGAFRIDRTWHAVDGCGNAGSAPQNQLIDIVDTRHPDFVHRPKNLNQADPFSANAAIECTIPQVNTSPDGPSTDGRATATDTCSDNEVTYVDSGLDGDHTQLCGTTYAITRTWVATDVCTNTDSFDQEIVIVDRIPPVITCPADFSGPTHIECRYNASSVNTDANDISPAALNTRAPAGNGYASAVDSCDPTLSPLPQPDDPTPDITNSDHRVNECGVTYRIDKRTWRAGDECDGFPFPNSSTCPQVIDIDDTTPPDMAPLSVVNGSVPPGSKPGVNAGFRLVTNSASDTCDADLGTPFSQPSADIHAGQNNSSYTCVLGGQILSGNPRTGYSENLAVTPVKPGCTLQPNRIGKTGGGDPSLFPAGSAGIRHWFGQNCVVTCTAVDDCGNTTVKTYDISADILAHGGK